MKNEIKHNIEKFILGGKADFCIVQDSSGNSFQPSGQIKLRYVVKAGRVKGCYLVSAGEPSNTKLMYLGTFRKSSSGCFIFNEVSDLNDAGKYMKSGLMWVLARADSLPAKVHIVHNGRCAVCGRVLLDADSVARGVGPTCANKIGI